MKQRIRTARFTDVSHSGMEQLIVSLRPSRFVFYGVMGLTFPPHRKNTSLNITGLFCFTFWGGLILELFNYLIGNTFP